MKTVEIEIYKIEKTEGTFLIAYVVDEDLLKRAHISPTEFAFGSYLAALLIPSIVVEGLSVEKKQAGGMTPARSLLDIINKCADIVMKGIEVREYRILDDGTKTLIDSSHT